MKKRILSLLLISFFGYNSIAQVNHDIEVANFMFTPASLTIDVGDTVTWTNISGTHNINGTTTTFSSNPASFDNGVPATGWTYFFIFTVPGTYSYQCDQHTSMLGSVTVNSPSELNDFEINDNVSVYPNPFSDKLTVELNQELLNENVRFELYDLLGNKVRSVENVKSELTWIETQGLSNGIYIYAFKSDKKVLKTGKLTNK